MIKQGKETCFEYGLFEPFIKMSDADGHLGFLMTHEKRMEIDHKASLF
jgi:hypothetical protein